MVNIKNVILVSAIVALGTAFAQPSPVFAQCQGCHQPTGAGIPGAFPPLAGHVPEILSAKDGRTVLIQIVLYGMQGPIEAKGAKYNGMMPAFGQLKDEELAGVLNHIATQWGNDKALKDFKPFTAAEVKALRATKLTSAQVHDARVKLGVK